MFGDNKSVVDSSMQLSGKLHKHHTMLSLHHVLNRTAPWLSSRAHSHVSLALSLVALVTPTLLVPLVSPECQNNRWRARQAARVSVHFCRIKYKVKLHKSVMQPYAGFC
jgi:hypothetical protein